MAPALLGIWQAAMGARHPILPALWAANVEGDASFRADDLLVATEDGVPVGFVLTKRWRESFPGCERFAPIGFIALMAVHPAHQRAGIGTRLLADAEARVQAAGCREVRLGGSFHHFLPGIPGGSDAAARFFASRGYVLGQTVHDVRRRLDEGPPLPEAVVPPSYVVRPYQPEERQSLAAFLLDSFPGRWARDVAQFLNASGDASTVMGVFEGERPLGFAWIHPPHSDGALRWAGFNPAMAALGPIGVSAACRGKGLGLALLVAGIRQLAALGAKEMVIDWTDLLDFYGRCGFTPWLRYTLANKVLA